MSVDEEQKYVIGVFHPARHNLAMHSIFLAASDLWEPNPRSRGRMMVEVSASQEAERQIGLRDLLNASCYTQESGGESRPITTLPGK